MKHRQWKKEFEDSREPSLGKAEDMHLVHYSPQAGLKYIDPKFSGTGVDSRTKGRETEHPHSFYYRHGTEPEEVVTGRAANKYHVKVGADKPVYDIGQDPKGLVRQAIEENQGIANMDIVHGKLKEHGFHGFHNSSHPSLSNVVAMYHPQPVHNGEMEKAEELKKGSLQARTPFKPTSLAPEDKKTVGKWQTSVSNEGETERAKHREVIPRMEGNARARALHKLSGQTKTRMTPEGKREFLMHRGMSTKEKNGVVDENTGTANHENSHSSWTPDFSRANNFAWGSNSAGGPGHVVSAWTHEDNVHFIPSQFGATIEEGHPEQGKNRWRGEQEVIVKPNHNSKLHSVSPYKERLDENPKDIHNAINARAKERTPKIWPSTSPEEAAKLKAAFDVPNPQRLKSQISSRFGKSESLEKALKRGDDPVDRSKKFPHPSGHAHFNVRTTAPSKGTGGKQEYEVHHTETASAEKPYPQPTWHDTYPSLKDAHQAIKEKQAKPCPCDKCNMEKSEIQPLLKPWSSQAQAAWGHSPEGKAALGGEAAVKEWDAATKGKHLPKHVKKSEELKKAQPKPIWEDKTHAVYNAHDHKAAIPLQHKFHGQEEPESRLSTSKESHFNYRINPGHDLLHLVDKKANKVVGHMAIEHADEGPTVKSVHTDTQRAGHGTKLYHAAIKEHGKSLRPDDPHAQEPGAKAIWGKIKAGKLGKSEEKPLSEMHPTELTPGKMYDIKHSSGSPAKYHRSTAAAHHFSIGDKAFKVNRTQLGKSEDLEKGALKNAAVAGAMLLGSHAHAASGHLHQFVSGLNNLPGVKAESTFTPNKKGKQDGQGQYRIKVGNYTINGQHHSMGGINNHHTSMEGPKNPTPKDKEDENKAQFLRHKLTTTGQALLDKSEDLEKGAVKNLLTAGAMGAALASASPSEAHAPSHEPLHPQSGAHPTTGYDRNKVLNAISQVESSGGKNTAHKPTSIGTAYGKFAEMPDMIHDTIRLNPDLKRQHQKALNLQGDDLHRYMQDNPKLEEQIADKHLSRLEHHFGQNPEAISFAWNQGVTGTNRALKAKHDISSHPYVQKFKQAYEGRE